ncbi:MAG: hypothetical protein R3190_10045 [Thermoanaerobaculia bacterium]|nr:hypothetical protein [Thermoanaerobaculia bacterium]
MDEWRELLADFLAGSGLSVFLAIGATVLWIVISILGRLARSQVSRAAEEPESIEGQPADNRPITPR